MSEADSISFQSWRATGFSGEVLSSEPVLKELRDFVIDGYMRLARGGIEVGGVLFGEQKDNKIWVEAWRPIACEHSKGPSFDLSERDLVGFERMLSEAAADPSLAQLEIVGWFVSHTRSEIHIRPEELTFWNQHFGKEWQVALVLKPARFQPVRAGYFFRNDLGQIQVHASVEEFTLPADENKQRAEKNPLQPIPQRGGTAVVPALERWTPAVIIESPPLPEVEETRLVAERAELRSPQKRRRAWGMFFSIIAGALLGSIVRIGLVYYWDTHPDSLGLKLNGQANELLVQWDREQIRQLNGQSGEITISEDNRTLVKAIDGEALRLGTFAYQTQAADVKVRLRVFREGHVAVVESARFLTTPTPPPVEAIVEALASRRSERRKTR